MSTTRFSSYVKKSASHHPLLTTVVVLFVGINLLLGLLHDGLIVGEVSVVVVQRFKREVNEIAGVGKKLKKELTTWDDQKAEESARPAKSTNPVVQCSATSK